ncbi:Cytoplasmic dynein 1 intermediate chain 2 isoform 5 [Schistosoma japonicum]|uniref:Cytoplasmic dynein 1 intermediate chain 2 isoform 5 n=1 Tax=Schistosoma japonicum TaxID=6182 RepID=A0A4Z2DQD0_SCHJA|nr:Cytoplasmic dynein 1 intermediate chain 2 isoform 5 [Schistosoma japonicum]
MSTFDRKAELELKKAKLALLRENKIKRDKGKFEGTNGGIQDGVNNIGSAQGLRIETEELLRTLGIPVSEESLSQDLDDHNLSKATSDSVHMKTDGIKKRKKLGYSQISEINVLPKENISYSKLTQTFESYIPQHVTNGIRTDSPREVIGSPKFMTHLEWDDEFSTMLPFDESVNDTLDMSAVINEIHKMPLVSPIAATKTSADIERENQNRTMKVIQLTEEERDAIMRSDKFSRFFDRASRLIERALDEPADMFVDYSGGDHDDSGNTQRHQLVRFGRDFFDDRWSRRRLVTALDWSPVFPELLLGAYHANDEAPHDPDGVCLVWNLKFQKTTPEYIFHCQSAVTSATFATYHPNLIIGGTYSGQIVLWDNRSTKRTPVQRTPLSASAHTHPVHAVMIAGSLNAHNLLSISSDGKLCTWSLDMLGQPQQAMELTHRQARTVAATCMSFVDENVNNFLVGSEDGRAYAGSRHGNQAGISDAFEGHQAPITSISSHPLRDSVTLSPLFLTTSLDWSVKLWSVKETRLICSFEEASDYVFDAHWSPIHPALFATVDCTGRLDLWNLNQNSEWLLRRVDN